MARTFLESTLSLVSGTSGVDWPSKGKEWASTGTELMNLLVGGNGTDHDSPVDIRSAGRLASLFGKHRVSPEMSLKGVLPRTSFSKGDFSPKDFKSAGFVPSYMAVPEKGQKSLRTWRHPYSNFHIHDHGDKWLTHEDAHPSWAMERLKAKLEGKERPLFNSKSTIPSAKHVVTEGVPGYMRYVSGLLTGSPSWSDRSAGNLPPTAKRVGKGLASSGVIGALAAASALASDKNKGSKALSRFGTGAGGTAGYLGGIQLSNLIEEQIRKRVEEKQTRSTPTPGRSALQTSVLIGVPLLTAIVGGKLGSWLTSPGKRKNSAKSNTQN